jgi:hypothetical protein|tara:strand:+ start:110 stop:319 length:210 start_codon:yes stop_codon:yes gene_type:complete
MSEGNVISFKVFVDSKGNLMTEYSKLPIDKVSEVFDSSDTPFVQKILRELEPRLETLHSKLENELNALT